MKKIIFINVSILILIGFIFRQDALSWNAEITHRNLSKYAGENSVLNKDKGDYLKNFGFDNGLQEKFKWDGNKTIKEGSVTEWVEDGGEEEDAGNEAASDVVAVLGAAGY